MHDDLIPPVYANNLSGCGCEPHIHRPVYCDGNHRIFLADTPFEAGNFIYWDSNTQTYLPAIEGNCDLMVIAVDPYKTWFDASNTGEYNIKNFDLKGPLYLNSLGEITTTPTTTKLGFIENGLLYLMITQSQGSPGFPGNQGPQGNQGFQGAQGSQGNQGFQGAIGLQGFQGAQGAIGLGAQGFQGAQGSQGNQGFQGATGAGTQGAQGFQGSTGSQGNQGSQGAQGATGSQGSTGAQGNQGNQGNQGAQGSIGIGTQGNQGVQGFQGAIGSQGNQGATGAGTQGAQGFQGSQGAQGNQGNQGFQGSQGSTGSQGNQGFQGSQGNQGNQGTRGFQGFQGAQGSTGSQGFQGSQGAGAQGAQGFQGAQGAIGIGIQGAQGSQGNQGVQGSTGTQGNQGFQGATGAGVQGSQGNQGFQGTQGATGLQGNQGFQGTQGATGLQGNQGFQGSQGSTGAQGNQGSQGVQGSTGSQGSQGFQGSQGSTGSQGSQGFQGFQGAQGNQGNQGFQGTRGFQGFQGSQGNQGSQGSQGTTGSQGPQGFSGVQGYQGATGAGTQGAQGNQGVQGNQGNQGNQGIQGSQALTSLIIGLSVDYTTTGNITLSGLGTQPNGTWPSLLTAGARILVKDNTASATNGVYIASAGGWTRASDFNTTLNILQYTYFLVKAGGTSLSGTGWMLSSTPPYTINTTPLVFSLLFDPGAGSSSGSTLSWTPPTANADGMWITYNGLYVRIAGTTQRINSANAQYYAYTSTSAEVSNTLVETTVLPGQIPLSIQEQTTNNIVNVTFDGFISFNDLANTVTLDVLLDSTSILQIPILGSDLLGAVINTPYHIFGKIRFSAQSINGASASISVSGSISVVCDSGTKIFDIIGATTANTTKQNNLNITATWDSASVNNSVSIYVMQVQHLNSIQ